MTGNLLFVVIRVLLRDIINFMPICRSNLCF